MVAIHIIVRRAGLVHLMLGERGSELTSLATWEEADQQTRTGAEVVAGLETIRQLIAEALSCWTPTVLQKNSRIGGQESPTEVMDPTRTEMGHLACPGT